MLGTPNLIKVPIASYPLGSINDPACGTYKPAGCSDGFSCHPYGSDCIDSSYDPGCSWTLGIGAGGAAITVGVTVGIVVAPT